MELFGSVLIAFGVAFIIKPDLFFRMTIKGFPTNKTFKKTGRVAGLICLLAGVVLIIAGRFIFSN